MTQFCLSFPQNPNLQFSLQSILTPSSSSALPHLISSSSGFGSNSNFGASVLPLRTFSCTAVRKSETIGDYHSRPLIRWKDIYDKVWLLENPDSGVSSVLSQCEIDGKMFEKSELFMFVKHLRKFRRYKLALEVLEWMSNRPDRFDMFIASDMAVKLHLIGKVHGISFVEEFFTAIPDYQKDRQLYGALLNAYVEANDKDRAEKLMQKMRRDGFASFPFSFNRMMTMYMKRKEYDKIETLISEMKRCKIRLDLYSYNIWLYARGSQGSVIGLEDAYEEMQRDKNVSPNWSTFSSMATLYLRLGELEKAKACMKSLEKSCDGKNRLPYHYLLNLYGRVGEKNSVYRLWAMYKSQFETMANWGYHSVIHSLVRVGDIDGAEKIYTEWFNVKSSYDARISNILLRWYVEEGNFAKVEAFFAHMEGSGGKPIASSWEIVAESYVKRRRIFDALGAFRNAKRTGYWNPRAVNVSGFVALCEEEGEENCKLEMVEMLREMGLSEERCGTGVRGNGGEYGLEEKYGSDPEDEVGWSGSKDCEMVVTA